MIGDEYNSGEGFQINLNYSAPKPAVVEALKRVDDIVAKKVVAAGLERYLPEILFLADMEGVVGSLCSDQRAEALIPRCLHRLGVANDDVNLTATPLQSGGLANHVLCEIEGVDKKIVVYIARHHINNPIGRLSASDYDGIFSIKRAMGQYGAKRSDKYLVLNVVTPLGISTMNYQGRIYTVYATEFLPDLGEIHYTSLPLFNGHSGTIPAYHYALDGPASGPNSKELGEKYMPVIRNAIVSGQYFNPEFAILRALGSGYGRVVFEHQRTIFRACAQIFVATGGMFPKDFAINAGDFMGKFDHSGRISDLTLITARGGLSKFSVRDWLNRMYLQKEKCSEDPRFEASPFANLTMSEMKKILKECDEKAH